MQTTLQSFILSILLLGLLTACQPQQSAQFNAQDITGADFKQTMKLTDHNGKVRTLADFKGKVVAMFFGYTHCPDVCPTTMMDLKQTMKLLGDKAEEVQVLFVTVDPERDTKEVLAQFVPTFDKRFLGLTGSVNEIKATKAMFKIFASKVHNDGHSGYTIDHSAGMYIYDKANKIRLYVPYGQKPAEIASDIQQLL